MSAPEARIYQDIVRCILSYKPVTKIVLFGSRANGDYAERSDIDIAVFANAWTPEDVNIVHDRVNENVQTVLKIDVLAHHFVQKESLRQSIIEKGVVLYDATENAGSV